MMWKKDFEGTLPAAVEDAARKEEWASGILIALSVVIFWRSTTGGERRRGK